MSKSNYYNRSQTFTPPPNYGGTIKYRNIKSDKIGIGEGKFVGHISNEPMYSLNQIPFRFPKGEKTQSESEPNIENGKGGKPDVFGNGTSGIFAKGNKSVNGFLPKSFSDLLPLDGVAADDLLLIALTVMIMTEKSASCGGDDLLLIILCLLLLKKS